MLVVMPAPLDIGSLSRLKDFVADRPEYALLAFSMAFNIALFLLYVRAKDRQVQMLERWLPIVDRLNRIVERMTASLHLPPGGDQE